MCRFFKQEQQIYEVTFNISMPIFFICIVVALARTIYTSDYSTELMKLFTQINAVVITIDKHLVIASIDVYYFASVETNFNPILRC